MTKAANTVIDLNKVVFSWKPELEPVLCIPTFSVARGEKVFLKGRSGSGKTTLLSLIAAVLQPDAGDVTVDGQALATLRGGLRDRFRADTIGLVFQQFNLLPYLSVSENVQLSCRFSAYRKARALSDGSSLNEETHRLLSAMKLIPGEVRDRRVSELSVGQQQRVAVARALIGKPPLIIADEPTSSLDADARQAFIELLFSEVAAANSTLLFVSHDGSLASNFDRHIDLSEINTAATHHVQGDAA